MRRFAILPLAIAMAPLGAQEPKRRLPLRRAAFVIDLDTTGGFTGRGRGGLTIDADGRARAMRLGGVSRDASECRTQVTSGELEQLHSAVADAIRHPWASTFAPAGDNGCCDRMKWTLRLLHSDAGDRTETFLTTWYDGNERYLSKDLAAIKDVAVGVLTRTLADCGLR